MPRDGTGTHSNPFPNFVNGTASDADQVDSNNADMSAALTQSLAKDGQTTPTANLPMGNFRHLSVSAATARTDYARAAEVQDGTMHWPSVGGTGDVITLTTAFGPAAYAAGQSLRFRATAANTTAVTVNWNTLGAKSLKTASGAALASGDIAIGDIIESTYDGTDFRLHKTPVAAANFVPLAGGTMTGDLIMSGAAVMEARATAVASAGTVDMSSLNGNSCHITGTTTITAITLLDGQRVTLVFDGALTLTHAAGLVLPGAANMITAAGTIATFVGDAASVTRMVDHSRQASAITTAILTQATARLLGRTTAATGAVEEITVGAGLSLAAGALTATGTGGITTIASGSLSGTSVSITGIPADYAYLNLKITGAQHNDASTRRVIIQVDTDNGASYDTTATNYNGMSQSNTGNQALTLASLINTNVVANTVFLDVSIDLRAYHGGARMQWTGFSDDDANIARITSGMYMPTAAAINAIQIAVETSGSFVAGTYALYGIK